MVEGCMLRASVISLLFHTAFSQSGHDLVELLHSSRPTDFRVKNGKVSCYRHGTGRIFAVKLCQGFAGSRKPD